MQVPSLLEEISHPTMNEANITHCATIFPTVPNTLLMTQLSQLIETTHLLSLDWESPHKRWALCPPVYPYSQVVFYFTSDSNNYIKKLFSHSPLKANQ